MNQKENKCTYFVSFPTYLCFRMEEERYEVNPDFYKSLFIWLQENNRYIKVIKEYKSEEIEETLLTFKIDLFQFLKTIDFLTIK